MTLRHHAACFVTRLRGDRSGLALIEFAMILPVLLTLYLGGYQLMDAIGCNRKVTITARATADLVSQYSQLGQSDVASILGASTQIMFPYAASKATIRVSEITTDNNGVSKITWSQAINGTAYTAGTAFAVPPTIKTNGTALVYAEVSYAYSVPVSIFRMIPSRTLTQAIYMVPRKSSTVDCADCA